MSKQQTLRQNPSKCTGEKSFDLKLFELQASEKDCRRGGIDMLGLNTRHMTHTVDQKIFAVKIFSSVRGATKIKHTKN